MSINIIFHSLGLAGRLFRQLPSAVEAVKQLDRFEKQIQSLQTLLESDLSGNNVSSLTGPLHALKGSASYLAADRLQKIATSLEAVGKAGDLETLRLGLDDLRAEIERCLAQLPALRAEHPLTPGMPVLTQSLK